MAQEKVEKLKKIEMDPWKLQLSVRKFILKFHLPNSYDDIGPHFARDILFLYPHHTMLHIIPARLCISLPDAIQD